MVKIGEVKEGKVGGIGTTHEENEIRVCFRIIWETEGQNLKHLDTSLH